MAPPRRMTAAEAATLLRPTDSLTVPLAPGQPSELLHALGERDDWQALSVFTALLIDSFRLFTRPGVELRSGFFGAVERKLRADGHSVEFLPADFRRFGHIAKQTGSRVIATAAAQTRPGEPFSLSLHAGATVSELHRCGRDPDRLLIVECNRQLPYTLGLPPEHSHALDPSEVDIVIETDRAPFTLNEAAPRDVERRIAAHALRFVGEGSTLQTGIGGIPNQIVSLLAEGPGGGYGVHSEMFTTGLMELHRAGKVANRKGLYDGVSVSTFAMGTLELYQWLHRNQEVRFLPVEKINTPSIIGCNRDMVSINGAIAVDLFGQVAADTLGGAQYTGIGGHEDFTSGASLAEGGRSLICLPSTATNKGEAISRISAALPPGVATTTPRHQVDVVVTEHGAAELAGLTVPERRDALLAIAAPEFRDALREEFARFTR